MRGFLLSIMSTYLTLRILGNGDELSAQCETDLGGDYIAVNYYRNDDLKAVHEYPSNTCLKTLFDDIEIQLATLA